MNSLARLGIFAGKSCFHAASVAAKAAVTGCSALVNLAGKTVRFVISRPYLLAGVIVFNPFYFPMRLICTSRAFAYENPNGLPFFEQYSSLLAEKVNISESELSQGWSLLERGYFKATYQHALLPNHVVKVGCQRAMEQQFTNAQLARTIVNSQNLDHIKIPDSTWIANQTASGVSVSLDEKLEFGEALSQINSRTSNDQMKSLLETKIQQLEKLIKEGDFCDINLRYGINARFLKNENQIGVFDLDCTWKKN